MKLEVCHGAENIYELTEVDPEVKKDTKSFNSLSEDVKNKVVVPKKMKSDFQFNIFITSYIFSTHFYNDTVMFHFLSCSLFF